MSELGKILGQSITNQNSLQQNLVKPGSILTRFLIGAYKLKARSEEVIVEQRAAGTSFIIGSSTNGIIGTNTLGTSNAGTWYTAETITTLQNFTNDGRNLTRDWIASNATSPTYFAIGTGTTTFSVDDTALGTQTQMLGNSLFSSDVTVSKECILKYETFSSGITGTVNELGWFNASSSGTMLSRRIITALDNIGTYWYRFSEKFTFEDDSVGDSMIVDSGLNLARDWLGNETTTYPSYTEWGMGIGTVVSSDTTSVADVHDRNAVDRTSTTPYKVRLTTELANTEPTNNAGTTLSVFLRTIGLSDGIVGGSPKLLDNCGTDNWTPSTDATAETLNSTTYREGGVALDLGKSGTATGSITYDVTISPAVDGTGLSLATWVKVADTTELAGTNTCTIRVGNNAGSYYSKTYDNTELNDGWNLFENSLSSMGTVGAPDVSALDYLFIEFRTDNAGTTVTSGDLQMDYWHLTNRGTATLFAASRFSPIYKTSLFRILNKDSIDII